MFFFFSLGGPKAVKTVVTTHSELTDFAEFPGLRVSWSQVLNAQCWIWLYSSSYEFRHPTVQCAMQRFSRPNRIKWIKLHSQIWSADRCRWVRTLRINLCLFVRARGVWVCVDWLHTRQQRTLVRYLCTSCRSLFDFTEITYYLYSIRTGFACVRVCVCFSLSLWISFPILCYLFANISAAAETALP